VIPQQSMRKKIGLMLEVNGFITKMERPDFMCG